MGDNDNDNDDNNDNNNLKLQDVIDKYIESLNEMEQLTLEVAKQQLESSFDIHKSIGFIDYLKTNNITISS